MAKSRFKGEPKNKIPPYADVWMEFNHCETCKCGQWVSVNKEQFEALPEYRKKLYLKDGVRVENLPIE